MREKIPPAGPLGAEEELAAGGCPDRVGVEPRVKGDARERCAGQIPEPDVQFLVPDEEREARAVRREPWIDVGTRRCGQRRLLALPVHPYQAASCPGREAARDVDQRPIRRHGHVCRAGRGRLHLGQNRH